MPRGCVIASVLVSTIYGQNIFYRVQDEVASSNLFINTESWETGLYVVKIKELNRSEIVKIIIKSSN